MLPSDQVPPDAGALMRRLDDMERQIEQLAAAKSVESTTIRGGPLKVTDSSGNDIVRMGLVPSVFAATTPKPGFDLIRPAGNKVLHYESPGFWAMYDSAGRIVVSDDIGAGKGLARPWLPVPLYRMFEPAAPAAGATGYATVAPGVLAKWEGRISVSHPWIQVDGVWGQASGTNTATYQLLLGGETAGTWTTGNALDVSAKGPFNVTRWINQDWLKIEVGITASAGSGQVAIQPLGCYLRQT